MAAAARQRRLQAVIVRIPSPILLELSGYETILLFLFPPLAAVGRVCPAVLRVMRRLRGITGNSSLNL
ncbi:hypothetical protein CGA96_23810, partial [Salmonella enterica subsp. enterica]|nr:hypothetical protein [Salmonella enterica subsp. enterica serovar Mbandaka]